MCEGVFMEAALAGATEDGARDGGACGGSEQ